MENNIFLKQIGELRRSKAHSAHIHLETFDIGNRRKENLFGFRFKMNMNRVWVYSSVATENGKDEFVICIGNDTKNDTIEIEERRNTKKENPMCCDWLWLVKCDVFYFIFVFSFFFVSFKIQRKQKKRNCCLPITHCQSAYSMWQKKSGKLHIIHFNEDVNRFRWLLAHRLSFGYGIVCCKIKKDKWFGNIIW